MFVGGTGVEKSVVHGDYWKELEEGAAQEGLTVEEYRKKVDLTLCVCVCVYVCMLYCIAVCTHGSVYVCSEHFTVCVH